jgi:hypothetical protein
MADVMRDLDRLMKEILRTNRQIAEAQAETARIEAENFRIQTERSQQATASLISEWEAGMAAHRGGPPDPKGFSPSSSWGRAIKPTQATPDQSARAKP